MLKSAAVLAAMASAAMAQSDWPTYGHDPGGARYSPLTQIDSENVGKLTRAWTYHMKPTDGGDQPASRGRGRGRGGRSWEVTPLVTDGVMYLSTAYNKVVALEPETGKEIWSSDIKGGPLATRGIEYWVGDKQSPPELFLETEDGRLIMR